MKVPQHTIVPTTVKTVASEELQAEVEQELAQAVADESETPDISELLQSSEEEEEEDEDEA